MEPRMMRPVRIVAPAASLLTRADLKAQGKIESTEEDELLDDYAAAAVQHLDGWEGVVGKALVTQSWSVSFSAFPAGTRLRLPLGPLVSVTSISWRDAAGVAQTFSSALWRGHEDHLSPFVELVEGAAWPAAASRDGAVTVLWRCGYGETPAAVPATIRRAAAMLAAHWHDRRHAADLATLAPLPMGVESLLAPHRAWRI